MCTNSLPTIIKISQEKLQLIKKFYKQHYKIAKPKPDDDILALYIQQQQIGCVLVRELEPKVHFFTALVICQEQRNKGYGRLLLQELHKEYHSHALFGFCAPRLIDYYQKAGFEEVKDYSCLPNTINNKRERIQRSKSIAVIYSHF